jgi:3-keto-disaccharide hydrolase
VIGGHQIQENSKQTFLIFPYRLRDFELRLKYKFLTPRGNSGIQFRSKLLDRKTWRVGGYQADIDATGSTDGSLYDEAGVAGGRETLSHRGDRTTWSPQNKREAIQIADPEELLKTIHLGDWNDVTLVARGNHITYGINGRVMTELIDDSPSAVREGFLAFQLHQGFSMNVQFKDARVRKLD